MKKQPNGLHKKDLNTLSKEDLLISRIKDLHISIETSDIKHYIDKLYDELSQKGLIYHPKCYLTDEWGCPNEVPIIGIPFYLAHPKLKDLEKEFMYDAEGGTKKDFMKLLRHETGHAYNYAYRFYKRRTWRNIFGLFSQEYDSNLYKPRPHSKKYVRYLDNWYAQCHPDEDFAETFAVWLSPDSDWENTYKNWPAIKKLNFVDSLMKEITGKPPIITKAISEKPINTITACLNNYYKRRRKESAHEYPDFYDKDLHEIFSEQGTDKNLQKASIFLRKYRNEIINTISYWTSENKYTANELFKNLVKRCNDLQLVVNKEKHTETMLQISVYLTTLIVNYSYTGTFAGE